MKTETGVADIVQAQGESVWGVLYEIGDDELAAVDRKEGRGWAYEQAVVPVRLLPGGAERTAVTYVVRYKEGEGIPPSSQYLRLMIAAPRERGLPTAYVESLIAIRAAGT